MPQWASKTNWGEEVLPLLTGGGTCLIFAKSPLEGPIWFQCLIIGLWREIKFHIFDKLRISFWNYLCHNFKQEKNPSNT